MEFQEINLGIDPEVLKIINPSFTARCVRRIRGFINHWAYKIGLRKY